MEMNLDYIRRKHIACSVINCEGCFLLSIVDRLYKTIEFEKRSSAAFIEESKKRFDKLQVEKDKSQQSLLAARLRYKNLHEYTCDLEKRIATEK
jgi:hypothetical protein